MFRFFNVKFLLLFLLPVLLHAEPLFSPSWGFRIDLPEGYQYVEGNEFDRYSFQGPFEAMFDIAVYGGAGRNIEQLINDVSNRLGNTGDTAFFSYSDKAAALVELNFQDFIGWGICVELPGMPGKDRPLLLALAYSPDKRQDMDVFHLSALDSIIPSETERRRPGLIMEFTYPRGNQVETKIWGTDLTAFIRKNDAEASQALVDREFALLTRYQVAENWREAWIRFYRMICRDSWDRVADAVFRLERNWNTVTGGNDRAFAEKALSYVQGFQYERDPEGSDFVNLVSAITEGRGDCDSRAMLWSMILRQANIPAAIMVSQKHSHAMGLADIAGNGARFESHGIKWLAAETTGKVGIGLIDQTMSDSESWLAVIFE